jgi:hypothetical protein
MGNLARTTLRARSLLFLGALLLLGACERNEDGILYLVGPNGPEHIVTSDTAYPLFVHSQDGQLVVRLPECGDFTKRSTYNYRNVAHSNWSCATQRNFGAMLANPADLTGAAAFSTRDAARTTQVVRSYRAGAPTLSQYGSIGATPAARGGF